MHDAVIALTEVWFEEQTIRIVVLYHPSEESPERIPAEITFKGVTSVAVTVDVQELKAHRFAGTVNYWRPDPSGTTYLYLPSGTIAIEAKEINSKDVSLPDWNEYRAARHDLADTIEALREFSPQTVGLPRNQSYCMFCGKHQTSKMAIFKRGGSRICVICAGEALASLNKDIIE